MSDSPPLFLQELLSEDAFHFRVHNVKLTTLSVLHDELQPLLVHYDSLEDDVRQNTPLTPALLKLLNTPMRAEQANQTLGLASGVIEAAMHIKISGTTVLVCDELTLALHLHFTNTAKSHQISRQKDSEAALRAQAQNWQMAGNVNLLYKNTLPLNSVSLDEEILQIQSHDGYQRLPNAHALATTHAINTIKHEQPTKFESLEHAIIDKVLQTHQATLP